MTHRALIVAAVSTTSQAADDKASIPRQIEDCRAVCAQRGWQVASEITIPGHSRAYLYLAELVADCPEYGEVIRLISSGKISLVVVWAYDRLWRTDALRAQVTAICREHKVQVYALNQPSEPTADGSSAFNVRMVETFGGLMAESENETRVRRMKAGKEGMIRKGLTQYGKCIPYGYLKGSDNLIVPDPLTAPVLREIFEMHADRRLGYHAITQELSARGLPSPTGGDWHHNTVRRIISNPIYKGVTRWGQAVCENALHEPLVSIELWERAQGALMATRRLSYIKPLAGICRCGYCGYAMAYEGKGAKRARRLRCGHYLSGSGNWCYPNSHNADKVEQFVLDAVLDLLGHREAFIAARAEETTSADTEQKLEHISRELADLATRKKRGFAAYDSGVLSLDEYAEHRRGIEKRETELQRERGVLQASVVNIEQLAATLDEYAAHIEDISEWPASELNDMYLRIIKQVNLKRGEAPEIHWM